MTSLPDFLQPRFLTFFSFSKEDSMILKGYGILFMIFHHTFGLYVLPPEVDTAWISPCLTQYADIFKICVAIFFFITGYAMTITMPRNTSFLSSVKIGVLHYFKFWQIYLFCLLLVVLISWSAPAPTLPSPGSLGWESWILSLSGLRPSYLDWWYMGLFAVGTLVLFPACAFFMQAKSPLLSIVALWILSLLPQIVMAMENPNYLHVKIPNFPHFIPLFIFGCMSAFFTLHLSKNSSWKFWMALLTLAFEIITIHYYCFCYEETLTLLFLFSLWCLPYLTNKLHLTSLLTLLGTYSALMWLSHRFIFGYHFSREIYGTHSYVIVYGSTVLGSLILAIALQWLINQIPNLFHLHPSASSR